MTKQNHSNYGHYAKRPLDLLLAMLMLMTLWQHLPLTRMHNTQRTTESEFNGSESQQA